MEQRTLDAIGVLIMSPAVGKNTPCQRASPTKSQKTKKQIVFWETVLRLWVEMHSLRV